MQEGQLDERWGAPLRWEVLHTPVFIRAGPSRQCQVVGQRASGDKVLAIGMYKEWLQLDVSEADGGDAECWAMWNASLLGLGQLLKMDVQQWRGSHIRVHNPEGCLAYS